MARFQFDKKQLGPALAMGVVSVGLFVYAATKIMTPPPLHAAPKVAQAPTAPAVAATKSSVSGASATVSSAAVASSAGPSAAGSADPAQTATDPQAPALPGRDPFTPQIVDDQSGGRLPAPVKMASTEGVDNLPRNITPLPPMEPRGPLSLSGGPSLGAALAATTRPVWSVTGVLSEPAEPQNRVAILRSGDSRRFVRLGDMVDDHFRLVNVSRTAVVLSEGSRRFTLPLGGGDKSGAQSNQTQVPPSKLLPTGSDAPDFTVQDASGKPLSLSDFRGKVVVLDFWATWCGPCQKSLPSTNDVAREYAAKNVVVLAINAFDTSAAFQTWLPLHSDLSSLTFGIDTAEDGRYVGTMYMASAIPTQYVIDRKGKIVTSFMGYSGSEQPLEDAIDSALAE